jgi:uncharacterized protein YdbL (DUF1318 family)
MKPDVIRQLVAAFLLVLAFQSAWAIDLHAAKEQGVVGEANTGYLAPIGTFKRTAEKTGATLQQVQFRFYELAVQRTKPGHYYQDPGGSWKQK